MNSKKLLILVSAIVVFYPINIFADYSNKLFAKHKSPLTYKSEVKYYTFGVVPQFEQRKLFNIWRPILDELELRTNIKFKMIGTSKIPDFTKKFLQGEFDFAYMNPYHILLAFKSQSYIPIVRDGGRTLNGIIVVHKNSNLNTLQDLNNLNIAFPSKNALGASLLVKSELKKLNINYNSKYVQTHSSVYLHVAKKLYPSGGGVLSTLLEQNEIVQNSLKIIYTSNPVAPHPISVHPRVPEEIRLLIKNELLKMSKSKYSKKLLAKVPIKKLIPAKIEEYLTLKKLKLDKIYATEKNR